MMTDEIKDLVALATSTVGPAPLAATRRERNLNLLLDPVKRAAIVRKVADGYPTESVLGAQGVSRQAFQRWRQLAADSLEPYASFAHEISVAEQRGVLALVKEIRRAGKGAKGRRGDWTADKWLLEKLAPAQFGPEPQRVEVTVTPTQIDPRTLSDDQLAQLEAIYASRGTPRVVSAEPVEEPDAE